MCPMLSYVSYGTRLALVGRSGVKRADHWSADLHPLRIRELFKHRFKSRIRLTNAFGVLNNSFPFSEETRYGKRHCDAMIAEARHLRTVQRGRPRNFEAIVQLGHLCAHGAQIMRDCRNAISFFNAQFPCLPNNCSAVCQGACNRQNRQFVNKSWHLLALDDGSFKRKTSDFDNSARLTLIDVFNSLAHLRTHAEQNAKQRGSSII